MVAKDVPPGDGRPRADLDHTSLTELMNNLPGMVYRGLPDSRRTFLFVSQGVLDLTGYESADLIDNGRVAYGDLIHPDDRLGLAAEIEAAVAEKRSFRYFYRMTTATGQERWVLERGQVVVPLDCEREVLDGFITDHTARMQVVHSLERRVMDRNRQLAALFTIMEVAGDPTDLPITFRIILDQTLEAIQVEAGFIHLLDQTGDFLRLVAHEGLPPNIVARLDKVAVEDGRLPALAVDQSEFVLVPNLAADDRTTHLSTVAGHSVYVAVPIAANESTRGVLSIFGTDVSQFAATEDVELLLSVGEAIGVVVENARLREQAQRLMVIEERNRLARELHDSVTQSLYSVTLFAEAGRVLAKSGELQKAAGYFNDVLQTGQQALKEMRLLVHRLRPSLLEQVGLVQALQQRLNAVEGRAGVKNQLIVEGVLSLSPDVEEALFYIAQEALNNTLKHAAASEVSVWLQQDEDGEIELEIVDNGQGFDPVAAASAGGLGLTSMNERAAMHGGHVSIHSSPEQGTRVQVRLPANGEGAENG